MTDLNKLMAVEGAVGAFKFSSKGELTESKIGEGSGLNEEILDLLCHVCVAILSCNRDIFKYCIKTEPNLDIVVHQLRRI